MAINFFVPPPVPCSKKHSHKKKYLKEKPLVDFHKFCITESRKVCTFQCFSLGEATRSPKFAPTPPKFFIYLKTL